MSPWCVRAPGVLSLPSGRLVRGRDLRRPQLDGALPDFGVYLLKERPEPPPWEVRWVRWPDFRLPTDRPDAHIALLEAWHRATNERVGARLRRGLWQNRHRAGLPGGAGRCAAVETPWQRRYFAKRGRRHPAEVDNRSSSGRTCDHDNVDVACRGEGSPARGREPGQSQQHERITVTVHGRPSAVLVAPEDLESLEETLAILSDPDTMRRLSASEVELAAGEDESESDLAAAMERRSHRPEA